MTYNDLPPECRAVVDAAANLLHKIDWMTAADFSHGEERPEREALRKVLEDMGYYDREVTV